MKYPKNFEIGGIQPRFLADPNSSVQKKKAELNKIVNGVVDMNPHKSKDLKPLKEDLDCIREFTRVYREFADDPLKRELECHRVLYPSRLDPIRDKDLLAGRFSDGAVGFSPELWGSFVGYYMLYDGFDLSELSAAERKEFAKLATFWDKESTPQKGWQIYRQRLEPFRQQIGDADWDIPKSHKEKNQNGGDQVFWFLSHVTHRFAGVFIDGEKLVRLGIPGLLREIEQAEEAKEAKDEYGRQYLNASYQMLELFRDNVLGFYATEAQKSGKIKMAKALQNLQQKPPQSFFEAVQLTWLYVMVTRSLNIGRVDLWWGKIYDKDLRAGKITEAEAQELMDSFWALLLDEGQNFNTRIILGGVDTRDVPGAKEVALLCIEATRRAHAIRPQTTLRIFDGMSPEVYDAALRCIGEGCTFPMLLHDDVNLPSIEKAFEVPSSDAAKYVPLGCGELMLDHTSIATPNSPFHTLKCLEYALNDGKDLLTGAQVGLHTGDVTTFKNFEDLWAAYKKQCQFFMEIIATMHTAGYETHEKELPFLLISALYDDCIARARPLFRGGVRYLDGSTEVNSFVSVGDSLYAIQELVYKQQKYSLPELKEALSNNFYGAEALQKACRALPKYGNDHDGVDAMVAQVHEHICKLAMSFSGYRDAIRKFFIVHVNNHAHVQFGAVAGASADGRFAHETVANANNPTPGRDANGTTAMLKSLAKMRSDIHSGVVQNMKFSKAMFTKHYQKTKALLQTYFSLGGTQAMITVVSRADLEAAIQHPEEYQNLVVRVGGYSARFVDLSREIQLEILQRTLNDE